MISTMRLRMCMELKWPRLWWIATRWPLIGLSKWIQFNFAWVDGYLFPHAENKVVHDKLRKVFYIQTARSNSTKRCGEDSVQPSGIGSSTMWWWPHRSSLVFKLWFEYVGLVSSCPQSLVGRVFLFCRVL